MKKVRSFGVMMLILLVSCQSLDKTTLDEDEKCGEMNVSIVASIGRQNPVRTVSNGSEEGIFSFCAGDEMGIFVEGGSSYKWELHKTEGGNEWRSDEPMKWPVDSKEQTVNFCAYSPYVGEMKDNEVVMPDLSAQTGELDKIGGFDFLVAYCLTSYESAGGEVHFVGDNAFKHVFSLVTFNVKGDLGMSGAKILHALFRATGIATQAKYVFNDTGAGIKALPLAAIVNELRLPVNRMLEGQDMRIYAIVNPLKTNLALALTYERNGVTYVTKEVVLGTEFLSNNMYTFSLSVNKGEVFITGADISPWTPNDLGDVVVDEVKKEGDVVI